MTKKQIKLTVDEDLYGEFKKDVRRVYGKVHGNMSKAVEDAITVYMRVGLDPDYHPPATSQGTSGPEGGSSSHPKNQDQIDEFFKDFKERFYGYSRVQTQELTSFIMSETGARSETTIKKWRNRLRNKSLIYYTTNGWWSIKASEDYHQATLSPVDTIHSHLTIGERVSFKVIQDLTSGNEKATKEVIARLEKEGKLKFLGPGFWKVTAPEDSLDSFDSPVSSDNDY